MTGLDSKITPTGLSPRRLKRFDAGWIRPTITVILILVLATHLDIRKVFRTILGFDKSVGIIMIGLNISLIFLFARRWQIIAKTIGFNPPYTLLLRAIWIASFLGQIGPTLPVAEATRFQILRRHAAMDQLLLSQITDRLSGQIVLFAWVLILYPFYAGELHTNFLEFFSLVAAAALFAGLIFRLFLPRIRVFHHARRAFELLVKPSSFRHYGLSLLIQGLLVLNFSLAAAGIGLENPSGCLFLRTPLLFAAITLFPIAISDWGSREAAATILLSPCGLNTETVVSISVLFGLTHLCAALPGGLLMMTRTRPPMLN